MDNEVSTLLAIEQIKALKARYFRCMDCKDWTGLRDVFTADLVADFRDSAPDRNEALLIHGADEYMEMLTPVLATIVTVHHGHMPEIVLTSPSTATGIWAMEDNLWAPAGAMPWSRMQGYGHYHELYRKSEDRWRIAEIRLSRLHIEAN